MPKKSICGPHSFEAPFPQQQRIRSTTVLCVRRDGRVVMAGDGQVTLGDHVIKHSARKIRRLYQEKILAGFAGSTAAAFSLFARFESKVDRARGRIRQQNSASGCNNRKMGRPYYHLPPARR